MNEDSLLNSYRPLLKKFLIPLLLFVFGLTILGYGLIGFSSQKHGQEAVVFSSNPSATESAHVSIVHVDVAGAVNNPGVYKLSGENRIEDAIKAAGGFSNEADLDWIAKNLNLAAKISDESKLYVPKKIDLTSQTFTSTQQFGVIKSGAIASSININTATLSELDTLSGIGPATAQKIIDNRPYSETNDLVSKKVVSQKVFDKIKTAIRAQ